MPAGGAEADHPHVALRDYGLAGQPLSMGYTVYILQSASDPASFYTGVTQLTPEERLAYHNRGKVPHTAGKRPWHWLRALSPEPPCWTAITL